MRRTFAEDLLPMDTNAAHSPHAWAMDSVEWDPFALAAVSTDSGESGKLGAAPTSAGDALTPRLRYARSGGCQVPGCTSTLALTTYQRRAMLCGTHINADALQLPCSPLAVRFCQKCRRLHALSDFSGKQHTCRAALALVRQRRNKAKRLAELSEDSLSPASKQTNVLDFDSLCSLLLGSEGRGGDTAPYNPAPVHPYNPPAPAPPAPDADDWLIPLPECLSLELKLPLLPTAALPPAGVRSEILASLSMQVGTGALSPGRAAAVAAQLFGAIKPGCTHLTVDATCVAPLPRDSPLRSADTAGAALLAGAPSMAAAGRMEVGLRRCGALGSVACVPAGGTSPTGASHPSPLHVSPMALLSGAGGSQVTLRLASGGAVPSSVSVRLNGQFLRVPTPLACPDGSVVVTLPPCGAEGCACVDAGEGVSSQPLCVVLLSASQRLVDEVNAAARATSPHAQRTLGALQLACWAVGQALAVRQPHVAAATPPAWARLLATHGAACALRFGWRAALEECLAVAGEEEEEEEEDGWEGSEAATAALTSSGSTLLHQAAQAACPLAAARVLQLRPQLRGGCGQPDASGSTPLHVAARRGAGAVLAALCAERPAQAMHDDASAGKEGARALLAFWAAREGAEKGGATPARLAQRHPGLAPLTAHLRRRVADAARLAYASLPSGPPLALASLAVAHRRLRESPPSPHTAVALELLKSLLAGATRRDQALTAARVQADAHALLSYAALTSGMYCLCLLSRSALGLMTDQEVIQSLQQSAWQPDWETWLRTPTCMCGHVSSHIRLWLVRAFMTATAIGVALVALAAGEARRCRLGTTVGLVHCALLAHVLILDPAWLAVSTYRRFGGVGVLRRPWRGGTVLLVTTVLSHLFSGTRPPPRTYAAIMVGRGVVPLLARGALAGPAVLQWLAWIKLVDASPWFDRLNLLVALAAAAHTAAAHRARQRPLAPKAC